MLEMSHLLTLERSLREEKVLSVYMNGAVSNPAERNTWMTVLERNLSAERSRLTSEGVSAEELSNFEAAVELLRTNLPDSTELHSASGWVAFVTTDADVKLNRLPAHVSNIVRWDTGATVAPLLRTFKQLTPVHVAISDSRTAQLYRYREGALEQVDTIQVETVIGPVYHMGDAPRGGFQAGVRGTTGTDEAERVTKASREKLFHLVNERLQKLSADGWILLGGTQEACSGIEGAMPQRVRNRVLVNTSLHMKSSTSAVMDAAKAAASELRIRHDADLIESIAELAGAGGKGATGLESAQRALESNAVQTLIFTSKILDSDSEGAEQLVRAALRQGAEVEHATGDAAARLDELGGVAARLRFIHEGTQAAS